LSKIAVGKYLVFLYIAPVGGTIQMMLLACKCKKELKE
jgi:hypothetical protein